MAAAATPASPEEERPLDRATVLALVAMGAWVVVLANDFNALSVALPAIEKQFDTDVGTVQWVLNAYALTFGVLLVALGALLMAVLFVGGALHRHPRHTAQPRRAHHQAAA